MVLKSLLFTPANRHSIDDTCGATTQVHAADTCGATTQAHAADTCGATTQAHAADTCGATTQVHAADTHSKKINNDCYCYFSKFFLNVLNFSSASVTILSYLSRASISMSLYTSAAASMVS